MPLPARARVERPKSLRDYASTQLRDAIVAGDLAPGERLRDPELEQWLGVSRTPIREATIPPPEGAPWPSPTSPATG